MDNSRGNSNITSRTALAVLIVANTLLFALGAVAHLGLSIPWSETRILGASVVEGVGAVLLITALARFLSRKRWSHGLVWGALWFCFVGMLVGMLALAGGAAIRTRSNDLLHIGMVLLTTSALVMHARMTSTHERAAPRS